MERVYSVKDMDGRVCVDCTECARGWNGDQSCSAGWHHDRPRRGGCFCGVPLASKREAILALKRLPVMVDAQERGGAHA